MPNPTDPQAFNRYSYVSNNPLRYTDLTGNGQFDQFVLDFLNDIADSIGEFFNPSPPAPVFMTTPGLPIVAPVQPPSSFELFRPQITPDLQTQRLGFSGGFPGEVNQLAGGLFGLFGVRQSQLDIFQLGLAIGGSTPALGIFSDFANFGTDLLAFDFGAAAIDGVAAIPGFGLGGAPFAIARRVNSIGDSLISNPIPETFARVIDARQESALLGRTDQFDVFVTDANAILNLNAKDLARKLNIAPAPSFKVIEFPSTGIYGVASPINRSNPNFIGGVAQGEGYQSLLFPIHLFLQMLQ